MDVSVCVCVCVCVSLHADIIVVVHYNTDSICNSLVMELVVVVCSHSQY